VQGTLSEAPTTAFARWTRGRSVPCLGTNDRADPIAFQRWHKFKEAFAPELVHRALAESAIPVHRVIDPFSGSGTTALACQMLGIDSQSIEVNPFLVDVARAKLTPIDPDLLAHMLTKLMRRAKTPIPAAEYYPYLPPTFIQGDRLGRRVFSEANADRIAALMAAIDEIEAPETQRFFRVILGGILVEASNVVVNGKGRRYRRHSSPINLIDPATLFHRSATMALKDMAEFADRGSSSTNEVLCGDSRHLVPAGSFELAVFSPPYPNSFDYTDIYNIELWMLGYLRSSVENRTLRGATLSSHVQIHRSYAQPPHGSPVLDNAILALSNARDRMWNPHIPQMVGGYFADMASILANLRSRMPIGGQVWAIVGDSRYAGELVPVAAILCELSGPQWQIVSSQPIRHMRSSAQHGGRADLAETLLVLQAS